MKTGFIVLLALATSGVAQGGLLTNFNNSFVKYQACSLLMPAAKCYKLYCDPEGIQQGVITAFVDVPDLGGLSRFDNGPMNGIDSTHPLYTASLPDFPPSNPVITRANGRERYEARVEFELLPGFEPPGGEIVIFELHVHDMFPELGLDGVLAGFEFNPGDFVTIFTPPSTPMGQPTFAFYDHTQLQDPGALMIQVPEPATLLLAGCGMAAVAHTVSRRRTESPSLEERG